MNQEKIFFITDSACDIPAEDEKRLPNLAILPIPVTADGKGYYERESFTAEEFYDLIDRCQDIPATSHIHAITFQEKYEEAYQNGYTHVAVITIYSGASVLGGETVIGENTTIGGGTFITESVPANSRVLAKRPEQTIKSTTDVTD